VNVSAGETPKKSRISNLSRSESLKSEICSRNSGVACVSEQPTYIFFCEDGFF
jgi:hypothetical protein